MKFVITILPAVVAAMFVVSCATLPLQVSAPGTVARTNGSTTLGNTTTSAGSVASASSTAAPSTKPSTAATVAASASPSVSSGGGLVVGSTVSAGFYKDYAASYHKGLKWVFENASPTGPVEEIREVIAVGALTATVKYSRTPLSTNSINTTTTTQEENLDGSPNYAAFTPPGGQPAKVETKFGGYEDVTVRAGTYPGAAKLTTLITAFGADGKQTKFGGDVWLAKGVGVIKQTVTLYGDDGQPGYSGTDELTSFTP